MNIQIKDQSQLNLMLPTSVPVSVCPGQARNRRRRQACRSRAAMWFARMRHLVDCARDWPPAPERQSDFEL